MKKIISLSLVAAASLYAAEVELTPISVESTIITEVSQNAQVSADLAQALSTSLPSIDMNRRSGIANDIYIRGQKRDNISVEVDGTKTCGACVNRMDPPVSHVLASQIEEIEVIEGPYDVETFGTMSGGIKIKTKAPTQKLHGEVNFGIGSWNYTKVGVTASGGDDRVRVLISGSSESSDQYKDGDGNTMAEQLANNPKAGGSVFKDQYKDMDAYTKRSIMVKAFVTVNEDQELRLSYTANRSDNIVYANSKMDAIYDDSNIYSIEYNVDNITDTYKSINFQYYKSDVDHPMGTDYRLASDAAFPMNEGKAKVITNWLTTDMQGFKLKNKFDISDYELLIGLDSSERAWDGAYYKNGNSMMGKKSLNDVVTKNAAIFTKLNKSYDSLNFALGARFDSTEITNAGTYANNDYTGVNLNLVSTYNIDKDSKVFFGFGQATRVPDARELYFVSSMAAPGVSVGTPSLEQTTNQEIDFGYELSSDLFKLKAKVFYSTLSDYIYYNQSLAKEKFENIDATIYGAEFASSIYASDDITADIGISYKVGEKDTLTTGQTDTSLADIAPLRANLALNYEYKNDSMATLEIQSSQKWDDFDAENGEQELDAWSVLNLKVKHAVSKNFDFTLGINNLTDETYAVGNTYADLILIGANTDNVMLMNEPGRYIYTNLTFKF